MNIALEYIKYRLNAKGRHGIHSPFIYEMLDKCFKTPIDTSDVAKIKKLTSALKNDNRVLLIEDFGAGSKKMGNQRKVKQLFKISSSKGKFGRLFYQLSNYYNPSSILELGTSLGIGTIHFSFGNPKGMITTIEGCKETHRVANENFQQLGITNVTSICSTFQSYIDKKPTQKFDLIFIDGHHDGKALLNYCEALNPNIHDTTLIIIDDIRWSNSMFDAWESLKNSADYHVSIDLFRMGIIVPRKGQVKEHFIVKF